MLLGLAGNAITYLFALEYHIKISHWSSQRRNFFRSAIAFGMSTSLGMALFTRGVCGLINGNTGVVKSYVREITDDTNQARAYSIRSGSLNTFDHFLLL